MGSAGGVEVARAELARIKPASTFTAPQFPARTRRVHFLQLASSSTPATELIFRRIVTMETSLYKELSYRVRGFRTVSIVVAIVTVILCIVVGIGCWVLVAGVRENAEILQEMDVVEQKMEVEVVEGEIREPLHLKTKEPLNKVGRVVQHIAEIDFADGSPVDSDNQDVVAVAHMLQNAPAPTKPTSAPEPESRVDPDVYKTRFSQRYEVVPQQHSNPEISLGPITEVDGVVGVRLQPPRVEGAATNFMRRVGEESESSAPINGRYLKNELSVDQSPAPVYVAPQQQARPRPTPQPPQSLHEAVFETFVNLTNEVVSDIQNHGLFRSIAGRSSEKYMRDTFEWLGDYTSQLLGQQELVASRDKRSILGVSLLGHSLAYLNYAVFGNFLMNKMNAIAENNLQARKLSGDPTAEFLDATFWSKPSGDSSQEVLTAATDNWEPQVNKVSLAFIGEILHTLLNMMREFLMKDHVMECLWFMFCEDLNHQAQYGDVYGLLARVNSVGLMVLTEKDTRSIDTVSEVWRAVTAWENLQCDVMFPKCDGPKALEIVNEVAVGSGK